ncbi:MAG: alanine--tRNA ligase [Candidatus Magasanikbacteria bacterium CG10_big_fil_rev_8_21_14_0_10_36_16]|uniref:Alanine--tRNA ligase n=1 Tax=Candidatus Magasanikbacteria bacterium CG10_big_fil_rev_8_21_14_0_10_36_16 TaxID=1974645 RepID=A0A2H0TYR3_9BACT|nr:MAG: alanine--tRNA ligase [Candidatus Magasanikbacteria bacterium CG10_big_fil_rev_8_21_14_0_10_36_16]
MLNAQELRKKYLEFFESKGHTVISSASLIPENDPTVLFTTAGMHPLVPYLLGAKHPSGTKLTDVQKCVRTGDIDEVGDRSHLTFFEMLGNWSLGDYFKLEAIEWSFEFLTSKDYLGIDINKLAVSVFAGDDDAPFDSESFEKWKSLGIPEERIAKLPKKNNWWGPAGVTGPCGPDTEMFFWVGKEELPPAGSNPGNDDDNWLEIWNDVFMQYFKQEDRTFKPLEQQNVDTGMGLERTTAVLNKFADAFEVDTLKPIINKIEELSGKKYKESEDVTKSMRVVADHVRTSTMIMTDDRGVAPSNVDQGYIVRRLIRRAVRHGRNLGLENNFCVELSKVVISIFADVYPEVNRNAEFALTEMEKEETKFRVTLEQGIKEFEKLLKGFQMALEKTGRTITEIAGKQAFKLYDTFGFPIEMTEELAQENNLTIDKVGFNEAYKAHQELSRQGSEQKFKGGLADHGEMSVKYHTATHLLHAALRQVLGNHVEQKGSNITAERMRFDFSYNDKMTPKQIQEVEDLVNSAIDKDYPVSFSEMAVEEAKAKGAIGLFGDKYGERVKVYSVGDPEQSALANATSPTFSREICGGPHVEHTGVMGHFKIMKEESSSAGIRRIKAILE